MSGLLRSAVTIALLAAMSAFLGCGKKTEPPVEKSPIRQIDTTTLPPLGEYTPPLDGGRIEIAGPKGWELVARTKGYVVRFLGSSDDQYPMILVKAEDAATGPLTAENVVAFAESMAPAQPAVIGPYTGVLQLKRAKEPDSIDRILERLIFTTIVGNRTYSLELRTRQDRLQECQDMLFAAVAGMRQLEAESSEPAEDKTSGEKSPEKADEEKAEKNDAQKELEKIFE